MTSIPLHELVHELTQDALTEREKARALFKWMVRTITYDDEYAKNSSKKPRPVQHTLDTRKGICSDLTLVYLALLNSAGIEGNYVHVNVDYEGKRVSHACAEVVLNDEKDFG